MESTEPTQIHGQKYAEFFRKIDGTYYFVCYQCSECFQSVDSIIKHIEAEHLLSNPIKSEGTIDIDDYTGGSPSPQNVSDNDSDAENTTKNSDVKPSSIRLTCDYCNHKTGDIPSMEFHMLQHLTAHPFVCDLCQQLFKFKHLLDGHRKVVHDIVKDFGRGHLVVCDICRKSFSERAYERHVRQLHSWYHCDHCHRKYKQKKNLLTHIRKEHLKKHQPQHACTECGKIFKENCLLTKHVRYMHTSHEKTFFCEKCPKRFHLHELLIKHMNSMHSSKLYQCIYCGEMSKYKQCLRSSCGKQRKQSASYKTRPKIHVCPVCGQTYSYLSWLVDHIKEANCKERLQCAQCERWFLNRNSLLGHSRDWHSTSDFPCRYCSEVFVRRYQRFRHEKKHKTGKITKENNTNTILVTFRE